LRPVFLIGGGRDPDGVAASHRPFVDAVGGGPIVCLAVDEGEGVDEQRWIGGLRSAGAGEVSVVALAEDRAVRAEDVAGAAGIYVCGGLTPLYADVLAGPTVGAWLPDDVPYAGFSAGAAVAAGSAIVGGWRLGELAVCSDDAGEDLDQVEPRPGLGLVPFAVDVHASQWGTLTRLIHVVAAGLVDEGWAIDEHTCLAPGEDADPTVEGLGSAYHVTRVGGGGNVTVHVQRATGVH
jgi:cyanophycinase